MAELQGVPGLANALSQAVREVVREELQASLKQGLSDLATQLRVELRQFVAEARGPTGAALRANSRVLATPSNNTLGTASDDTGMQRVVSRARPSSPGADDNHVWTMRHVKSFAAKPKQSTPTSSTAKMEAMVSDKKPLASQPLQALRHAASSVFDLRRVATAAFESAANDRDSPRNGDPTSDARGAAPVRSLSFMRMKRSVSPPRLNQLAGMAESDDCQTVTVQSSLDSTEGAGENQVPCARSEAWNAPIIQSRRNRPVLTATSTTIFSPNHRSWSWSALGGCDCSRTWARARHFIKSSYFDYATVLLTIFNAALIGAKADFMARHATGDTPHEYRVLETAFCIIFTVELCLRMAAHRRKYFLGPNWRWNIFDCAVIAAELVKELMVAFGTEHTRLGMDFCFLRALHLLRIIQVVRVMRIVRYINELRTLATSILHSTKALIWTLLLLGLIIYTSAVGFTQLAGFHSNSTGLRKNFGSLGSAVLTLFQSVTGGLDWREAMDPLYDVNPLLAVAFTVYIAFVLFAVLNIITGVFLEAALRNAKQEKDDFMINNVRELFLGSTDSVGELTWEDFQNKLHWPQMLEYFRAIDVDPSEAKGVFQLLDLDDSGVISSEEFLNGCLRLRGPASALDLALLMHEVRRMERRLSTTAATTATQAANSFDPEGAASDPTTEATKVGVNPRVTVQDATPGSPVLLGNTFGAS